MNEKNLVDTFKKELEKVNGKLHVVRKYEDAIVELTSIIKNLNVKKIIVNDKLAITKQLIESIKKVKDVELQTIQEIRTQGIKFKYLEKVDLGISCADYLIAESGSVVLKNIDEEPRSLSLLPEHHLVISTTDKIVEKLSDALTKNDLKEPVTVITGPSRTADIEKVLVTGVHGPVSLTVFLFDINNS